MCLYMHMFVQVCDWINIISLKEYQKLETYIDEEDSVMENMSKLFQICKFKSFLVS